LEEIAKETHRQAGSEMKAVSDGVGLLVDEVGGWDAYDELMHTEAPHSDA